MAEKSDHAFRTISEVAEELDLPQHVLRFWETKFRQIAPLKRGGGRRYYRPADVELLRRIKSLLHHEGYTIKGVQRLLGQGGIHSLPPAQALPQPPGPEDPVAEEGADATLVALLADLESIRDLLKKSVA